MQSLRESGLPDAALIEQYDYWQLPAFQKFLETLPGFPGHIKFLSQAIAKDKNFMKKGIPGLRYHSANREYWKDKFGDGFWGGLFGDVGSWFSNDEDFSRFHKMIEHAENHFAKKEEAYKKQLQEIKEKQCASIVGGNANIVTPSFDDPINVAQVAEFYRDLSAQIPHSPGLEPYREYILERSKELQTAAASAYTMHEYALPINQEVLKNNPELATVADFEGNAAQARLHKELVAQINFANAYQKVAPGNPCVQINNPLIQALSSAAVVQDNPKVGFYFADACYHLNKLSILIDQAIPASAKTVARGVAMGMQETAHHVVELIKNPASTLYNDLVNTAKFASSALAAAYTLACGSPAEVAHVFKDIKNIGKFFYDHPDQAVALITQLVLPTPVGMVVASAKQLALTTKLYKAVTKQREFATALAAAGGKDKKVQEAIKSSQPLMQSFEEFGQEAAKKAKQAGKNKGAAQPPPPKFVKPDVPTILHVTDRMPVTYGEKLDVARKQLQAGAKQDFGGGRIIPSTESKTQIFSHTSSFEASTNEFLAIAKDFVCGPTGKEILCIGENELMVKWVVHPPGTNYSVTIQRSMRSPATKTSTAITGKKVGNIEELITYESKNGQFTKHHFKQNYHIVIKE